jgi:hypothetical protein
MIEALSHTPAFRARFPVKLLSGETAKEVLRIDSDCVGLANETI